MDPHTHFTLHINSHAQGPIMVISITVAEHGWKSQLKIDLGDTEKFFRLLLFQFSETEHEINVKGDGPQHDLLFVVTSLAKGINNAIGLKYVPFISSISLPFLKCFDFESLFMQQIR